VQQAIKEVLQGLVDDDLVHQEKIGISNFFWSFPAEASTKVGASGANSHDVTHVMAWVVHCNENGWYGSNQACE